MPKTMIALLSLSCLAACKHANGSGSQIMGVSAPLGTLDSKCVDPQPLGTYLKDPRYAGQYAMPSNEGDIRNFCRPSASECNASSPVYGHAVCEDATSMELCPSEDGDHPVLCYPALNP